MVLVRHPGESPQTLPTEWVRAIIREPVGEPEPWGQPPIERVDLVRASFFPEYVDSLVLPYARTFADRLVGAHDEVLTGEARIEGLTQTESLFDTTLLDRLVRDEPAG